MRELERREMPDTISPFSIAPRFEIPRISTRRKTPTGPKDQRIWNEHLNNPTFEQMVKEIRRQRKIRIGIAKKLFYKSIRLSVSGRPDQRIVRQARAAKTKLKPIDVVRTLQRFDLTPLWHLPMEEYILNGDTTWFPPDERDAIQTILCEDSFGRKRLLVEVFSNTDRGEFIRAWKHISSFQKQLPGYKAKWGRAGETAMRSRICILLHEGLKPTEVFKRLTEEMEPKEITLSEKPEHQKQYDHWLNTKEALRRLVYRVAREQRVTANVT